MIRLLCLVSNNGLLNGNFPLIRYNVLVNKMGRRRYKEKKKNFCTRQEEKSLDEVGNKEMERDQVCGTTRR
jgi:hypothetical protein